MAISMENFGMLKEAMLGAVEQAKSSVSDKAKNAMGKAKEMVGLVSEEPSTPQEQSILDELNQSCALTYKQRIYGFFSCIGLGLACTLLSLLVFFHPVKFALAFTLGNVLSLGSTGFLIGFSRQLTMMFDPVRIVAAILFIISMVLTLVAALYVRDPLLTILCIFVQTSSLLWYSLSYIPFAQSAAKRCFRWCYEAEF